MREPHYFEFSRNFQGADRLCASCDQSYNCGEHIEITILRPYTSYVCPIDNGRGHSSIYTGAYRPVLRTLRDHICICGQEFVAEDGETWRLSWEMQSTEGEWSPVQRIGSHHSTAQQRDGLLLLADQGESIRNIQLTQIRGAS